MQISKLFLSIKYNIILNIFAYGAVDGPCWKCKNLYIKIFIIPLFWLDLKNDILPTSHFQWHSEIQFITSSAYKKWNESLEHPLYFEYAQISFTKVKLVRKIYNQSNKLPLTKSLRARLDLFIFRVFELKLLYKINCISTANIKLLVLGCSQCAQIISHVYF